MDVAPLVLGIVAVVASAFIPLISYVCGIVGLVLGLKHRKMKNCTAAIILCIAGIICGIVSHVLATQMILGTM